MRFLSFVDSMVAVAAAADALASAEAIVRATAFLLVPVIMVDCLGINRRKSRLALCFDDLPL